MMAILMELAGFSFAASDSRITARSTIPQIVDRDKWAVAEGTHAGKPLIIRFRDEFRNKPDVAGYDSLVLIDWKYSMDKSGLPNKIDSANLENYEETVMTTLERDYIEQF